MPAEGGGFAPPGLPATATTAGGARQTVTYYASGDVATLTDPVGKTVRYSYDGLGRVLTETEITDTFPAGLTTSYSYDRLGRVLTKTEPAVTNRVTGAVHTAKHSTVYDLDGNVLQQGTADLSGGDAARTQTHTYNSYGQKTSTTDAAGVTTTFGYDLYGKVITKRDAAGGVERRSYDVEGHLLTTTLVGFVGDPNNPSPPRDLLLTSNAYDPNGRLASETDAMGWTTSHTYTDNGLKAKTTRTDGTASFVTEDTGYDAAGNVTNNGVTTTVFGHDPASRQTTFLDLCGRLLRCALRKLTSLQPWGQPGATKPSAC